MTLTISACSLLCVQTTAAVSKCTVPLSPSKVLVLPADKAN